MNVIKAINQNVLGKIVNHGLVFLINILLVRNIGVVESGNYFNELYLLSFFVFIFSGGLDYATIYWIAKEPNSYNNIFKLLLKILFLFISILLILFFFVFPQLKNEFIQPLATLVLFSIGNLMLILFQGLLNAVRKFNVQNYFLFFTNLICLLFLFSYKKIFSFSSTDFFYYSYAILFFIQGVLMIFYCWSVLNKIPKNVAKINWVDYYKIGFTVSASSLIFFCFLRIDNFFVQYYCDSKTLSNYVQCGKVGQYFLYFSTVISTTMLPYISSEMKDISLRKFKKMMLPYVLIIIACGIILLSFGYKLYPLLFGVEYNNMHKYMYIFMPGYIFLSFLTIINSIFIGNKNYARIIIGDSIGLIIIIILDFIFVPKYGAIAAATISSIVYCMVFIYLFLGAGKIVKR